MKRTFSCSSQSECTIVGSYPTKRLSVTQYPLTATSGGALIGCRLGILSQGGRHGPLAGPARAVPARGHHPGGPLIGRRARMFFSSPSDWLLRFKPPPQGTPAAQRGATH
eukprot:3644595-Pyramimonas_sp.AAC.1